MRLTNLVRNFLKPSQDETWLRDWRPNPMDAPSPTTLEQLIELAKRIEMSTEMVQEQARSWVVGEYLRAHPRASRAHIEALYDRTVGRFRPEPTPERLRRNTSSDPKGDRLRNKIRACSEGQDGTLLFVQANEERFRPVFYGRDANNQAIMKDVSTGHYLTLTDGVFAFTIRSEKPRPFKVGQKLRLVIEPETQESHT